jgi:hypothetical protein
VGDPDLSGGGRSLVETVREGDADAIAGFRDAHIAKVRSYCALVCPPDRVDEATAAAFRDFVARVRTSTGPILDLDRVLLMATRSAAAGRFEPAAPTAPASPAADESICQAMPELLAAAANGELRSDAATLIRHQRDCATCRATAERTGAAEQAFARATGWIPSG